ncbi:hypothetical protein PSACC_00736 [Paramicrosporidium saccamoebae]|uniref:Uncharacterized protein n=1 Tax=Paramicrosporidium saccamoebae TaxID=1246581 RepID=A0A2H9TNW9_9FUNG|nr:hypothetical protein PSACC_00736 [Paramicrosporidium saccamoebae]
MALSNAIGLLAVLFFLGHGLIRIPRRLWHASDFKRQLRKLEARALATKENLQDADDELATLTRDVQALPYRTRHHPELQPYVDELLATAPVPSDDELLYPRRSSNPDQPRSSIDLHQLEQLNYQIREAISRRDRLTWEWRDLLENAWYWQDVQSNLAAGQGLGWRSSVEPPIRSVWRRKFCWWWRVHFCSLTLRFLSICCIILSFAVFWSEVTLAFTNADLSLVRPLIGLRLGAVETLTGALLIYLVLCTYSSFLKLRVLSYFHLVPGQHTDEKSLLFFAAYITRLTFPLGYNYVTLVDRALNTEFAKVMGTMNLVPLLGGYFNLYVPLSLSIICLFTIVKSNRSGHESRHDNNDGREMISQARRMEERENHARIRLYSSNISSWRQSRYASSFPVDSVGVPRREDRSGSPHDEIGHLSSPHSSKSPSPRASASNSWMRT